MKENNYHIFIAGPPKAGLTYAARTYLEEQAKKEPTLPDLCYVHNFKEPDEPKALQLSAGMGKELRKDMQDLIAALETKIPEVFESEAGSYFMMFVGDAEFAAIAKEKGLVELSRPLTHELYLGIMDKLTVEFLRVEIHDMQQETFYANVIFRAGGEEHAVDSRPSDAIALALNPKIPVLVRRDLFRRILTEEEIKEYEGLVKSVKF